MRFWALFFSAVALLSLAPTASRAETITFDFTGHVTSVYDPFGLVGSLITTGDPVIASLRYDSTTPDFYPLDPTRGAYPNTPGWLKVDIDGLAFEKTPTVEVVDVLHGSQNQELLQALDFLDSPTAWPSQLPTFTHSPINISIGQTSPPFSLFSSDALPSSIDLSNADIRRGEVGSATQDLGMYDIQFALDSVTVLPEPTAIPEPGSATFLAGGLLLCWLCSARSTARGARNPLDGI